MKKLILFLFLCSVMTGGFLYYYKTNNNELIVADSENKSEELINMEEIENESNTETNNDVIQNNEDISTSNDSTNKNDMESNNTSNSNVVKKNSNTSTKKEEKKTDNAKTQSKETNQTQTKKTTWEELGISEYDYYHKPMWSWATVDYKIEDYGSFEKTHQACIDAGNEMDDIISFSCTNINSYSGAYLGDMLRVKK